MEQTKEMSLRTKIDCETELIKEKIEELSEIVEKINYILLPPAQENVKPISEKPEPKGWFEVHWDELEHIENILVWILNRTIRLLNAIENGRIVKKNN